MPRLSLLLLGVSVLQRKKKKDGEVRGKNEITRTMMKRRRTSHRNDENENEGNIDDEAKVGKSLFLLFFSLPFNLLPISPIFNALSMHSPLLPLPAAKLRFLFSSSYRLLLYCHLCCCKQSKILACVLLSSPFGVLFGLLLNGDTKLSTICKFQSHTRRSCQKQRTKKGFRRCLGGLFEYCFIALESTFQWIPKDRASQSRKLYSIVPSESQWDANLIKGKTTGQEETRITKGQESINRWPSLVISAWAIACSSDSIDCGLARMEKDDEQRVTAGNKSKKRSHSYSPIAPRLPWKWARVRPPRMGITVQPGLWINQRRETWATVLPVSCAMARTTSRIDHVRSFATLLLKELQTEQSTKQKLQRATSSWLSFKRKLEPIRIRSLSLLCPINTTTRWRLHTKNNETAWWHNSMLKAKGKQPTYSILTRWYFPVNHPAGQEAKNKKRMRTKTNMREHCKVNRGEKKGRQNHQKRHDKEEGRGFRKLGRDKRLVGGRRADEQIPARGLHASTARLSLSAILSNSHSAERQIKLYSGCSVTKLSKCSYLLISRAAKQQKSREERQERRQSQQKERDARENQRRLHEDLLVSDILWSWRLQCSGQCLAARACSRQTRCHELEHEDPKDELAANQCNPCEGDEGKLSLTPRCACETDRHHWHLRTREDEKRKAVTLIKEWKKQRNRPLPARGWSWRSAAKERDKHSKKLKQKRYANEADRPVGMRHFVARMICDRKAGPLRASHAPITSSDSPNE